MRVGLVCVRSWADGILAGARKGSGNFDILMHGRAAHAGRNPEQGRNAIVAGSRVIAAITELRRDGVTINPGYVRGGGALNVVQIGRASCRERVCKYV